MGILNNRVVQNASWIVLCRVLQSVLAFFVTMLSARYLGPGQYGLLSYASSVAAFVVPIAQLGLRNILVEEIVAHPEREGETLGTAMGMSVISSLFCIIGCISFAALVNAGERDTLMVCSLYSISLIFRMTEMIRYWYQAKLLSKYVSLASLAAYVIVAISRIIWLITGRGLYGYVLSYTLEFLLITAFLLAMYCRIGRQKLSFSYSLVKKLFSKSKYYILSGMMVTVFAQTDKIMIKMMLGNVQNGFYSTAVACANLTGFVFMAIIDSFRPVIFEYKQEEREKYSGAVTMLYSIVIYMGLMQSVVMTVLARPIVKMIFGAEYLAAAPILQIITWYTAFSYMGTVRNIWLLAEEKQRFLWRINLSGALLNVMGNLILIPRIGAAGAALASVVTQFFSNFLLCLMIRPIRPVAKLIRASLNPGLLLNLIKGKV